MKPSSARSFDPRSLALLVAAAAGCGLPGEPTLGSSSTALGGGPDVRVVASGRDPVDTAPDARGREFYFIGSDHRGSGVFRSKDKGGKPNPVVDVQNGAPLVTPRSLAVANEQDRLYVADRGANVIFGLHPRSGKVEARLAAGSDPRGVEVASCDDDETLYFTGREPRSGKPGLFRVDERGRVKTVATGAPFQDPDAVAVRGDGVAFVSDTPGVAGAGRVLMVDHGAVSVLAQGLNLGDPAGVALTLDGATLLVSGVDGGGHSQVYLVDTNSGAIATFAGGGIGSNTGSGGVHRAAQRDVFGWAGFNRNGGVAYSIALGAAAYNGQ